MPTKNEKTLDDQLCILYHIVSRLYKIKGCEYAAKRASKTLHSCSYYISMDDAGVRPPNVKNPITLVRNAIINGNHALALSEK